MIDGLNIVKKKCGRKTQKMTVTGENRALNASNIPQTLQTLGLNRIALLVLRSGVSKVFR